MGFFKRFAPLGAYRDLRTFLGQRKPYELGFFALAICITWVVMFSIASDSHVEKQYRPNIIYVQQWRADRTDAEIIAQQKTDAPKERKAAAEAKKRQDELQAGYKRLDDQLKKYGI